ATTPSSSIFWATDVRPWTGRAPLTVCILRIVIGIRAAYPSASAASPDEKRDQQTSQVVFLKQELHRELDVPRKVVLARDLAEVGAGRIGVRVGEHRVVERVEELGMQLRAHPAAQRQLLHDRDIPEVQPLTAQPFDARRKVAEVVGEADAL